MPRIGAPPAHRSQRRADRFAITHIDGVDGDRRAQGFEFSKVLDRAGRFLTTPPDQRDVTSAVLGEPARYGKAKSGEAAGHDITSVATQRHARTARHGNPGVAIRH